MRRRDWVKRVFMAAVVVGTEGTAIATLGFFLRVDATARAELFSEAFLTVVMWLNGLAFARFIAYSRDSVLFALTPLEPALYFWRNLARAAVGLALAFVALPAVLLWTLSHSLWLSDLPVARAPFAASYFLTGFLFVLVPLNEILTRRPWSRVFFFPRTILLGLKELAVRSRMGALPILALVVLILLAWIDPDIRRLIVQGMLWLRERLLAGGALGQFLYYLMLPFGALWHWHSLASPPALQWALPAMLAFLIVPLAQSIRQAWNVMPEEFEPVHFEAWLTHRQAFETGEETAATEQQEAVRPVSHIRVDGFPDEAALDPGLTDEPRCPLVYDPTLSPEMQVVRHSNDWSESARVPETRRYFFIPRLWISVVVFGWIALLVLALRSPSGWPRGVASVYFVAIFLIAILAATAERASRYYRELVSCTHLPLRWWAFVRADLRYAFRYKLAADALASLLFVVWLRVPVYLLLVSLATLFLLRLVFVAAVWFSFWRRAGKRFTRSLVAWTMISTMALAIFSIVAVVMVAAETGFQWLEMAILPVTAWAVLMCLLLLPLGAFTSWRVGSQLLGPPERPPDESEF
jgi:hypothetical protein